MTLGQTAGTHTVTATLVGEGRPTYFSVTALPGAPAQMTVISGANQTGVAGEMANEPLVVRIEDPDHLGTGRVELSIDGKLADGDRVTFPRHGAQRRVIARLLPVAETDAAPPVQAVPEQRRSLEGS